MSTAPFPLSALVGQDELKLALLLHGVDPRLGGVLIRGEKGSGKSTAARGLAALLPPIRTVPGCPFACPPPACPHGEGIETRPAPFVELPVGATEDRVVGTLDLEGALLEGRRRLQPGLLAGAHRGVLYVDEVNLLPDHLVDLLVDTAAFGVNRVERDGLAVEHESRFVLVGSMNPEEGELRPQLLDRFGLAVEVHAPADAGLRAEVVRRRLAHDADPAPFAAAHEPEERAVAEALAAGAGRLGSVVLPDAILTFIARLCAELGAEGLRADLVLARGAKALAALEGRTEAGEDDVIRLAALALAHRRRRGPLDPPGIDPADLSAAFDLARDHRDDDGDGDTDGDTGDQPDEAADDHRDDDPPGAGDDRTRDDHPAGAGDDRARDHPPAGDGAPAPAQRSPASPAPGVPLALQVTRPSGAVGRRARGPARRGAAVAARPAGDRGGVTDLALGATVTAAATRRALEPVDPSEATRSGSEPLEPGDLRQAVREARTAHLVILAVDTSGSMGAARRMEAAKGAVLSLLVDAYQRRDRVALITFAGEEAAVALRPTGSVEVARARLGDLPTGGRTPLAAGLHAAVELARTATRTDPGRRPVLVVVTDGRATHPPPDPAGAALTAAAAVARADLEALVVDAEDGDIRLGLARPLAEAMGAAYTALPDLAADPLARAISGLVADVRP